MVWRGKVGGGSERRARPRSMAAHTYSALQPRTSSAPTVRNPLLLRPFVDFPIDGTEAR